MSSVYDKTHNDTCNDSNQQSAAIESGIIEEAKKKAENVSTKFDKLLSMPPKDFADWLTKEFFIAIPIFVIKSADDMETASRLLVILANRYTYLSSLLTYAKLDTREAKRKSAETKDKTEYENAVDRKDSIENMVNSVKQEYQAVSRAITIYIENNAELRMNESGAIYRK